MQLLGDPVGERARAGDEGGGLVEGGVAVGDAAQEHAAKAPAHGGALVVDGAARAAVGAAGDCQGGLAGAVDEGEVLMLGPLGLVGEEPWRNLKRTQSQQNPQARQRSSDSATVLSLGSASSGGDGEAVVLGGLRGGGLGDGAVVVEALEPRGTRGAGSPA